PGGESVRLEVTKGHARVSVLADGRELASRDVELEGDEKGPTVQQVYWRPGGGAVAADVGSPASPKRGDGDPPPPYLSVMRWAPPAAAVKSKTVRGVHAP